MTCGFTFDGAVDDICCDVIALVCSELRMFVVVFTADLPEAIFLEVSISLIDIYIFN